MAGLYFERFSVAAIAARPNVGTIGIDGKMYDMPHLIAAERTLVSIGEAV
jgi:citrate lyase subunit beta / citryl-CoA lyase